MLSLKWKIFRVISYLHMTCTVLITVLALGTILATGLRLQSTDDILALITLVFVPTILLGNSSVNLFILEKFYPDRLPGKKLLIFSLLFFILCLLVTLLALTMAVAGFYDISTRQNNALQQNLAAYLLVSVITVIGSTGVYILWNQVSLRKAIRRNYEASLNNFLNSDQE